MKVFQSSHAISMDRKCRRDSASYEIRGTLTFCHIEWGKLHGRTHEWKSTEVGTGIDCCRESQICGIRHTHSGSSCIIYPSGEGSGRRARRSTSTSVDVIIDISEYSDAFIDENSSTITRSKSKGIVIRQSFEKYFVRCLEKKKCSSARMSHCTRRGSERSRADETNTSRKRNNQSRIISIPI